MYFDIFNDYLDFKILPWHKIGYDKGQYFPVRKTALRLLKIERVKLKWEEYEKEQQQQQGGQLESQQESEYGFALGKEHRQVKNEQQTSRGVRYTEVITNTAEFPIPSYEETTNWDEKESWKKYAAPLELDDYYREHPDEKPEHWVSPRDGLKTREDEDKEMAAEQQRKIEQIS